MEKQSNKHRAGEYSGMGSIEGNITVERTSGAGVEITAVQRETGHTQGTISENDATYRLPLLPGTYDVQAELTATYVTQHATVQVREGVTVRVDFYIPGKPFEEIPRD